MLKSWLQRLLPKRLRLQVGIVVSILMALTIWLYAWHLYEEQEKIVTGATAHEASTVAKSIANMTIPYVLIQDYTSLEGFLVKMAELPGVLSVSFCDAREKFNFLVTKSPGFPPVVTYSPCPSDRPGDSMPYTTIVSRDHIVAWHPVYEGALLAWVKVEYSVRVLHDLNRHLWRDAFRSGIIAVIVGGFLILLFLHRHIHAVGAITNFAKGLDERKGAEVEISDGSLETDQLVFALNQSSRRLHDQERSLAESEKKYRTLFEESKDIIFFSTFDGRFVDINPAGVELFGYSSKEEMLRRDIGDDVYVNSGERQAILQVLARSGFIKDYEVRMRRKNGDQLIVLMTATGVQDQAGTITAFRGILRDVTAERNLEEQLRHAQKMEAVGQLTGGIAHDFNTNLTTIIGFAHLLDLKLQDPLLKSHAVQIITSAQKAANLTRSLLTFSSRQVTQMKPTAINDVVNNLNKLLAKLVGDKVEVLINLSPDNPVIFADEGQMDQVLMNLAANARDAMSGRGMLMIETRCVEFDQVFIACHGFGEPGRYALVKVSDNGSGMDKETIRRIFDPFFTTKELGKGTGLGLSIVYRIITNHKGCINVCSTPDKGTTFMIYLPLVNAEAGGQQPPEQSSGSGGTEKILVAEDDKDLRTLVTIVLKEAGYSVVEAVDGDDAVIKFRECQGGVDLLLLDVNMPKKGGSEAYEAIGNTTPGIKVLFTSAYPAEIMQKLGVIKGDAPFLSKPVSPPLLLKKIREVLDDADQVKTVAP